MNNQIDEALKRFEQRIQHKEEVGIRKDEKAQEDDYEDNDFLKNALLFNDNPVVLGKSMGQDYLACLTEEEGIFAYPMLYHEVVTPSEVPEMGMTLQIHISTVHRSGLIMDTAGIDFNFMYILDSSKEGDQKIYEMYVSALENYRMENSGLVKPSDDELISFNGPK